MPVNMATPSSNVPSIPATLIRRLSAQRVYFTQTLADRIGHRGERHDSSPVRRQTWMCGLLNRDNGHMVRASVDLLCYKRTKNQLKRQDSA